MQSKARIKGRLRLPGDKSISHRALIFSAFARGTCKVLELSPADDCASTASCLCKLGVNITSSNPFPLSEREGTDVFAVQSDGIESLNESSEVLFAGNSGTTIRLMAGLLAGRPFMSRMDGDESLRKRPMQRVLQPLTEMGATVLYEGQSGVPPFSIKGGQLQGRSFNLQIASAQVQTAILLAGLQAEGETSVEIPSLARDHTARMFKFIGMPFKQEGNRLSVSRLTEPLEPFQIKVPADISSAAFFMVAAACLPGSHIILQEVGLNPGRTLVIDVLKQMGAHVEVTNERDLSGEPVADIVVEGVDRLKGTIIDKSNIAAGIDEIPVLALAGALCDGVLSIRDAAELRVKESDRLSAMTTNLKACGVKVDEREDGFDVYGQPELAGGCMWEARSDHRLAMTGMIANLLASKPVRVDDARCIAVSYPQFKQHLDKLVL